jgi:hypothetical protein
MLGLRTSCFGRGLALFSVLDSLEPFEQIAIEWAEAWAVAASLATRRISGSPTCRYGRRCHGR